MRIELLKTCFSSLTRGGSIEIPDGWADLTWELFTKLEQLRAKQNKEGFEPFTILQIKEKFGTLRCYLSSFKFDDWFYEEAQEIIDAYEGVSKHTCEQCGHLGRTLEINGWIATLCTRHERERRER